MTSNGIDEYVRVGRTLVDGWFGETNARLFVASNDAQNATGVTGDLMEIGVYKGRSAILLGFMGGKGETTVLCDTFGTEVGSYAGEIEDSRFYDSLGMLEEFRANWRRFHTNAPEIVVGLSSTLHQRYTEAVFRFIHLDGSHVWAPVVDDIRLVKAISVPGAIVAFDDIRYGHTPGVAAAVWGATATDGLIPLVITDKLFGAWGRSATTDEFQRIVRERFRTEDHPMLGGTLLRVLEPPAPRSQALAKKLLPPVLAPAVRGAKTRLVRWRHAGSN